MALKGHVDRDEIVRRVAERLGLPESEVALATDSQFKMVAQTMKSEGFRAARLPFFGQWKVKLSRLKFMQQRQKRAAQ